MKFGSTKKALMICLLGVLFLANDQWLQASDLSARANIFTYSKPLPMRELVLRNQAGRTVSMGDFKGRVVLLRFSSINCPACRFEEPMLEELKHRFGASGLEIVGVNLVDNPQDVAHHAASTGTSFPTFVDGGGFSLKTVEFSGRRTAYLLNPRREAILEVPGFPTTYILDCNGLLVGYSFGAARWNESSALALIDSLVRDRRACVPRSSAGPRGPRVSYQ